MVGIGLIHYSVFQPKPKVWKDLQLGGGVSVLSEGSTYMSKHVHLHIFLISIFCSDELLQHINRQAHSHPII